VDPAGCEPADYDGFTFISQIKWPFVKRDLRMSDRLKPLFAGLDSALEKLARQAAATTSLTATVQAALPETLRPHVVAAVRRGDDLVVIVDSAAWSARVRYAGAQLREQLQASGEPVAGKIRVRVGRKGTGGAA
jgi:hypothetical protein